MAGKTTAMLLCNSASACLLLALFVINGSLTHGVKISRDDTTTPPETTIRQGMLRGINMYTYYNRSIFGFLGIPYAQPPVGDLRFKAPVAPDNWTGILDASIEPVQCLQLKSQGNVVGDEDCLYLNVFTPQMPTSEDSTLLPVMMFIVGGGFGTGNIALAQFGPDFLLDEDVVLVMINFRTGLLGYLNTGDEVAPGNYGLKDAVRALEWIQENIEYFGGDRNRVTIFGASSGAMSVHLLALSDLTDGLIHRYITQSGSALSYTANYPRELNANRSIQLGEHFRCPTSTSTLLIDCLRGVNGSLLLDTKSIFSEYGVLPRNVWTPTVEPNIEGALLTDTPANLYAAGKIRNLPWIAVVDREEGLLTAISYYENPDSFEDFLEDIDTAMPYLFQYIYTVENVTAFTEALKAYYFNDLTADRSELLANFTAIAGDSQFIYSSYNAVRQQLPFAKSPVYFGCFSYRGTFSYTYSFSGGNTGYTGVVHGDESIYLFNDHDANYGPPEYEFNEADLLMIDTMVQLWTSFARDGIPTTRDSVSTITWEPYSSLNNYLRIGNGPDPALEMEYDFFFDRMRLWDELTGASTTSGCSQNLLHLMPIALFFYLFPYIL